MIELLKSTLRKIESFKNLLDVTARLRPGQLLGVGNLAGSFKSLLLSGVSEILRRQILVVAPDHETAERIRDDLQMILGGAAVRLFDGRSRSALPDVGKEVNDIEVLRSIIVDGAALIVTHPRSLLHPLPEPAFLTSSAFKIDVDGHHPLDKILEKTERFAFKKKEFVEARGDYALRGGILDVYPFVGENPIRLEFLGDTVESIREFDPVSQRSIQELSTAIIVPDILSAHQQSILAGTPSASLLDYLQSDSLVVLDEPQIIQGVLGQNRDYEGGCQWLIWTKSSRCFRRSTWSPSGAYPPHRFSLTASHNLPSTGA